MKNNAQRYAKFLKYIKGKSVAVVGSSACLLGQRHGSDIDDHDIVIRINRGIPYARYLLDVGGKTNVVSWGMGGNQLSRYRVFNTLKDEVNYFIYHWWDRRWVPNDIASHHKHVFIPDSFSRKAAVGCGNKPATTGTDCIHFILTGTECKQLSIYGIDFYKSGYWFVEEDSSIIPRVVSDSGKVAHNSSKEEEFLNRLVSGFSQATWIK